MTTIYIVKYSTGCYSDYSEYTIFATTKKSTATKYVTRFNNILNKLEILNKNFESKDTYNNWIADKYTDKYYRRWYLVRNTNEAYWEQIKIR